MEIWRLSRDDVKSPEADVKMSHPVGGLGKKITQQIFFICDVTEAAAAYK